MKESRTPRGKASANNPTSNPPSLSAEVNKAIKASEEALKTYQKDGGSFQPVRACYNELLLVYGECRTKMRRRISSDNLEAVQTTLNELKHLKAFMAEYKRYIP